MGSGSSIVSKNCMPPSTPPRLGRAGGLRMIYCYCTPFGDILLPDAPDSFSEGLLAQYQASGINAVWLLEKYLKCDDILRF